MPEPDVPDPTLSDNAPSAYWTSPSIGEREWVLAFFERYGFLFVAGLTVLALGFLLMNADLLLRAPASNGQAVSTRRVSMQADSLRGVQLTVTSQPTGAQVFIDEDSVGVTPLVRHPLLPGVYDISVQHEAQRRDTVLVLRSQSLSLGFDFKLLAQPPADSRTELQAFPVRESALKNMSQPPAEDERVRQLLTERSPKPEKPERAPAAASSGEAAALEAVSEPQETFGRLVVVSEPAGAEVVLDGVVVGTTPFEQTNISMGTHTLALRHEGFREFNTELLVEAGKTTRLDGALVARRGTLVVRVRPWGAIYIDDRLHSEDAKTYRVELPAGDHRMRVEHPALGRWEHVVLIPPGDVKEVVVDFNQ